MEPEQIDPDRQLGQLVEAHPEFARVFESLDVDYCCGGTQSLADACTDAGLELADVRRRLADAGSEGGDREYQWETLTQLANVVVWDHHRYLRNELPELNDLVRKVARVHGENHPELATLESAVDDLVEEMTHHIADEEQNVFPVIKKLDDGRSLTASEAATLRDAIEHLEDEHAETAARLETIRDLTDGYAVPDDACPSYRGMLERLADLERDTHMHVHRENNVLFPRAEAKLE